LRNWEKIKERIGKASIILWDFFAGRVRSGIKGGGGVEDGTVMEVSEGAFYFKAGGWGQDKVREARKKKSGDKKKNQRNG